MKHPDPDPLAAWADRALRQLPTPQASPGLSPRVLEAVRRRSQRPWYRRPWTEWSRSGQWTGIGVLAGAVAAIVRLTGSAPANAVVSDLRTGASSWFGWTNPVLEVLSTLGRAGVLILREFERAGSEGYVTPYLLILLGVAVVAWMSCLGLGTAIWRLARTSR